MSEESTTERLPPEEREISRVTVVKLLLFLVWWFSGIGVGTGFISPAIIGTALNVTLFLLIILTFFCSGLVLLALMPGQTDKMTEDYSVRSSPE